MMPGANFMCRGGKTLNAKGAKEEDAKEMLLRALCVFSSASFASNPLLS
jgi:hypothetical protein